MTPEQSYRAIVGGTLIDGTGCPPVEDCVVLIKEDRIVAVGKRGELEIPEGIDLIDASGKTVIPGLNDAHNHFLGMGMRMISTVDLSKTQSIAEAVELVKKRLREIKKGEWILGRGWDDSKWEERRFIEKSDLDPLSADTPMSLTRVCGHMITLNSNALEIAGITKDTPDPPGGQVDKGEDGEPTGVLRDARQLIQPFIPPQTHELALEGLKLACSHALSLGCTSIQDAGLDDFGVKAYQAAFEKGILKVRANIMWRESLLKSMEGIDLRVGSGNGMVRLGPVKMLMDGSLGARTAALYEPYEDDPTTKGLTMMSPEELNEKVNKFHEQGFQVAVHAIGDYGIDLVTNAIEGALKGSLRKDHRHRIEHCEILSSTQIERIRQLGIVASMQPNFAGEWSGPDGLYETRLGKRRLRQNNPYRFLLDEGIPMPFGSDGMPFHPLYGIWSAVNHPVKESRITLEEAVRAYTLDSAYASFEEDIKGSIEPGKLADMIIIDRDILECPVDDIKDTEVLRTFLGGKTVYEA